MASLAEQLQRLQFAGAAAASAPAAGGSSLRSFLFNAREAAGIDQAAACALGENGLAQLQQQQAEAAAFAPLFGPRSAEISRELQTAEENARLDQRLRCCVRFLGPVLQQACAHKMLEWLVRRFRVHEHCAEALLEAALPYHATNLFARIVRLLPPQALPPHWAFLQAVRSTGAPLDRTTLVKRCCSSPALLAFVAGLVPRAEGAGAGLGPPPHSVGHLVGLYASVAAGVLAAAATQGGTMVEDVLKTLLPSLLRGLKSHSLEQRAAAHLVTARLLASTPLEARLSVVLADVLCAEASGAFVTGSLQCLALLCQTQALPEGRLPPASLAVLLNMADEDAADGGVDWIAALHELSLTVNVQPLLRVLLASFFASAAGSETDHSALPAALRLITEVRLSAETAAVAVSGVLDRFAGGSKAAPPDAVQAMARALETRHGSLVDRELGRRLDEAEDDATREALSAFLASRVGGLRHASVDMRAAAKTGNAAAAAKDDGSSQQQLTLFLGLRHAEPSVRCLTLSQLPSLIEAGATATANDRVFLQTSLLQCMADAATDVVLAVLGMPALLLELVAPAALEEALLATLRHAAAAGLTRVAGAATAVLAQHYLPATGLSDAYGPNARLHRVLRAILPLLVQCESRRKVARAVAKRLAEATQLCAECPLLQHLPQAVKGEGFASTAHSALAKDLRAANDALFAALAAGAIAACKGDSGTAPAGRLPAGLAWLVTPAGDSGEAKPPAAAAFSDCHATYFTMALAAAALEARPAAPAALQGCLAAWLTSAVASALAFVPAPSKQDQQQLSNMAAATVRRSGAASRATGELMLLSSELLKSAPAATRPPASDARAASDTALRAASLVPEKARSRQLSWLAAALAAAAASLPRLTSTAGTEAMVAALSLRIFATASDAPLPGIFAASVQTVVLSVSPARCVARGARAHLECRPIGRPTRGGPTRTVRVFFLFFCFFSSHLLSPLLPCVLY